MEEKIMTKKKNPTEWDMTRIALMIIDLVSDCREKMQRGEIDRTDCIVMNIFDLGGRYFFDMLKNPSVRSFVNLKCQDSDQMIDNIRLTKTGLEVYIDC